MPASRRTAVLGATAGAAALSAAVAVALATAPAPHVTAAPAAASTAAGDTAPLPGVAFTLKSTPVSAAALKQLDDLAADSARGMKRQANLVAAASGAKNGMTWKTGCGSNDAVKAVDAKVTLGAWCFDNGDKSSDYWIPQGVATSRSAQLDGFVLSWYHRHLSGSDWVTDGSRITVGKRPLVEKKGAYQPVTLAIPTTTSAGKLTVKDVRPAAPATGSVSAQGVAEATQHQGGVALAGDYLYTADTSGLRVYDVRRTYQVATGKNELGVDPTDGKFYAHNEKYALFQTGMYRPVNAGSCPAWNKAPSAKNKDLCFSTVTYDPTTSPKSLLTAEYKTSGGVTSAKPMRVVRWPLNADGSLKADASGQVKSSVVYGTNLTNVQGVAGYHSGGGDTIYYSQSNGASPGAIYSDRDGDGNAPFKVVGPIGGESLAFDPYSGGDRVYGVTERRNQRMFYWIYRTQLQRPGMP
ncbi:hypothetical protein F8568_003905 [Actinomadura sp. LD22]|uniref:Secreted protein n=1 Tax=Actinomadura physcomitrii TaxID=2650748 RepID=A0A6I4MBN5_9ACTN|nr:hypothetical protein [Actinomadura physcomitrii]MVZ99535.1 hypothetical protein [Actinomadura physcomitrii]